jgi:hypothetical protein
MFRKAFSFGGLLLLAGALVLVTPGSGQAQHHGGGFRGGGFRGGFDPRFNRGFDRRFDPRFNRGFFDRRFDPRFRGFDRIEDRFENRFLFGGFDPRFDPRFNRGFFDPLFFRPF